MVFFPSGFVFLGDSYEYENMSLYINMFILCFSCGSFCSVYFSLSYLFILLYFIIIL